MNLKGGMLSVPKLQIVVDSVIAEGLKRIPGKSKTDKIRWALCVYQEVLKAPEDMTRILARAGERYRNGNHQT